MFYVIIINMDVSFDSFSKVVLLPVGESIDDYIDKSPRCLKLCNSIIDCGTYVASTRVFRSLKNVVKLAPVLAGTTIAVSTIGPAVALGAVGCIFIRACTKAYSKLSSLSPRQRKPSDEENSQSPPTILFRQRKRRV